MAEISFACPHCGESLEVDEEGAGLTMPCPACEREVTVPSPAPAVPLQASASGSSTAAGPVIGSPVPATGTSSPKPPPLPSSARSASSEAPGQHAVKPPPLPRPKLLGNLDQIIASFAQAFALSKIAFAVVAGFLSLLIVGILVLASMGAGIASPGLRRGMWFLTAVVALGLGGVTAGGLAHVAYQEQQGRRSGFLDACRGAGRRFGPLFGSAVLLALGVLGVGWIANRTIGRLHESGGIGSSLAALLFIPQTLINGALILCLQVGVLAQCAVVVSGCGPGEAVRAVALLVRRQSGAVVGHLAITLACVGLLLSVIIPLFCGAVLPSLATNAPDVITPLLGAGGEQSELQSMLGFTDEDVGAGFGFTDEDVGAGFGFDPTAQSERKQSDQTKQDEGGNDIRWISFFLMVAGGGSVPAVFWVCSFTRFYAAVASASAPPGG